MCTIYKTIIKQKNLSLQVIFDRISYDDHPNEYRWFFHIFILRFAYGCSSIQIVTAKSIQIVSKITVSHWCTRRAKYVIVVIDDETTIRKQKHNPAVRSTHISLSLPTFSLVLLFSFTFSRSQNRNQIPTPNKEEREKKINGTHHFFLCGF